jgi:hypothetical protein
MTCKECEEIENQNMQGKNKAYLRVGNANVLICACDYHFNILRNNLGLQIPSDAPVHRLKKG